MRKYMVSWQKKDKYLPLKRNTVITANSEIDAKKLCHATFGNEKKIDILSVEEVIEEEPEESDT